MGVIVLSVSFATVVKKPLLGLHNRCHHLLPKNSTRKYQASSIAYSVI
jgi:hypothetical protein